MPVEGVEPNQEKWDEMDGWRAEPCTPGTLVLIHGESRDG
jgi:phytanoyl-CoA hydroxylase